MTSDLFLHPNECKAYTLTKEHKAKQSPLPQKKMKKERKKERKKASKHSKTTP